MALFGPMQIDGEFGPYTQECLQRWLRFNGYYTTAYKIDGDFGKESVKALQRLLKSGGNMYPGTYKGAIDGDPGKMTWTAWWDYLHNAGWWASGRVYTDNIKPFKRMGSATAKMTQMALNANRSNPTGRLDPQ